MFDCAVVLLCGGEIKDDNLWRSKSRMDLAIREHLSRPNSCLMISSGTAGSSFFASLPESHSYLKELIRIHPDIDLQKFFIEDLSRDTVGNVYFSITSLKYILNSFPKFVWVSNVFHLPRIKAIVQACKPYIMGSKNIYLSVPDHESRKIMDDIRVAEQISLARFRADLLKSSNIEELIFLKHDLYSIGRFQDEIK